MIFAINTVLKNFILEIGLLGYKKQVNQGSQISNNIWLRFITCMSIINPPCYDHDRFIIMHQTHILQSYNYIIKYYIINYYIIDHTSLHLQLQHRGTVIQIK